MLGWDGGSYSGCCGGGRLDAGGCAAVLLFLFCLCSRSVFLSVAGLCEQQQAQSHSVFLSEEVTQKPLQHTVYVSLLIKLM